MEKTDYIEFESETGEKVQFCILEQTMLAGVNYLLVTDGGEEESEAYILQEESEGETESVYRMVEDEMTLEALSKVFEELLEDVDITV
ncbi:MAG: DUF1292 domain-containing protein [Clostridiaceae bacterium]|nr:DUF1292 domain-containing protein [Clostridiaceae bacterium]